MEVKTEPKPILKWAGGKQGLAGHLVRHFPEKMGVYFEPFIGGASVLLTLRPSQAVIADQNEWLIDTYHAIQDDWRRVAEILDTLKNTGKRLPSYPCNPASRAGSVSPCCSLDLPEQNLLPRVVQGESEE